MRNNEYSWFRLISANGFGSKSIHYIFEDFKKHGLSINDLFELDTSQLQKFFPEIGKGKFTRANFLNFLNIDEEKLYNDFQRLKENEVHIIGLDDERYPKSILKNMNDNAPPVLFCRGYLHLLNTKGVSIVGSRSVDDSTILIAKELASKLAQNGYNVISGYAKGIDTGAHLGALEAGGTTTIILSFGMNYVTIKKELRDLDWERDSLFITQFTPYEKFSGHNAMIRNKLVCAMSDAIVVIASGPEKDEEGKMSGTYNAGITGLRMNIPVFILSPQLFRQPMQGNNDLIKQGGIEFKGGMEIVRYLEECKKEPEYVREPKTSLKNRTKPKQKRKKGAKSKKIKAPSTDGQLNMNF